MMLRIKDFHSDYDDCIFYEGINHYFVYEDEKNYLLETIELMENGAEI